MLRENWLIVGISGATCSGKTTVAKNIQSLFLDCVVIHQDDYFHDTSSEKHTKIPELNHINFEILSSVDMDAMKNRIQSVLRSDNSLHDLEERRTYLEEKFKEISRSSEIVPMNECLLNKMRNLKRIPNILILDGFLMFNDDELHELCDLRFYFTIGKAECWERRRVRTYDPPDVPGYFDKYVWPHYLIHYEEVLKKAGDIKYIDGGDSIENNFKSVLHKLLTHLS
ncbi:UNVERIFIED_CONTAM: hypothetical protein PYX00_004021 [Menopon gallinae]|uniref:Phosphoribulokinase/uridine kinase domain-containing protein n=1 Tax=Menopon gallinae TaxID=328185 RepID=A0AAW2I343_9NEOP